MLLNTLLIIHILAAIARWRKPNLFGVDTNGAQQSVRVSLYAEDDSSHGNAARKSVLRGGRNHGLGAR